MALVYECRSELDAVNSMLEMAGELPVNDLSDTEVSAALLAQKGLHRMSRKIQSDGLNCNTEREYRGTPDVNSEIPLPPNALEVFNSQYKNTIYIRNGKLYDTTDQTFKFDGTVVCDVVLFLEYETLPQHAREYIMMMAARRFLSNTIGSKELLAQTDFDFNEAKRTFVRMEIKTEGNNILNSPGTADIVYRRAY